MMLMSECQGFEYEERKEAEEKMSCDLSSSWRTNGESGFSISRRSEASFKNSNFLLSLQK